MTYFDTTYFEARVFTFLLMISRFVDQIASSRFRRLEIKDVGIVYNSNKPFDSLVKRVSRCLNAWQTNDEGNAIPSFEILRPANASSSSLSSSSL